MTRVANWMKKAMTIEDDASLIEAIHLMKEAHIRHLPVMHKERLVGILTEGTIQRSTPGKATSLDTWELHYLLAKIPVREAMNPAPHTVTPETDIIDAARLLHDKKLYALCVTDDQGRMQGILTITDILEAFIAICGKEG